MRWAPTVLTFSNQSMIYEKNHAFYNATPGHQLPIVATHTGASTRPCMAKGGVNDNAAALSS